MMMIVQLLILAYVISMIVLYIVARSAIRDRYWRLIFCLIAAVIPFVAVFVIVKNLIHPNPHRLQYVSEIAVVEDAIEAERVKIFGVEPLYPSFAERWQDSCRLDMQRVIVWSDKATRKLKAFGEHWGVKHAA
jgi:hypothetical protein